MQLQDLFLNFYLHHLIIATYCVQVMSVPSISSAVASSAVSTDGSSDLLQNLLGVSDPATIEHMLDSAVDGVAERMAAGNQRQQTAAVTAASGDT